MKAKWVAPGDIIEMGKETNGSIGPVLTWAEAEELKRKAALWEGDWWKAMEGHVLEAMRIEQPVIAAGKAASVAEAVVRWQRTIGWSWGPWRP